MVQDLSRGVSVWNKLSHKYDELWVQKHSLGPTRHKVFDIVCDIVGDKKNFSLFDVGCGTGQFLSTISEYYPHARLYGMDYSAGMLEKAAHKNAYAYLRNGDICKTDVFDFIEENSIDIVTCMHSFPYYPDKIRAISNIHSVLKPNGYAIIVSASINNIYDRFVMSIIEKTASEAIYLSKDSMCNILYDKFEVEKSFLIKEKFYMPSIWGFVARK